MGKKKIYTVATAHLDTIWSWDFETTVSKYINLVFIVEHTHIRAKCCTHNYKSFWEKSSKK